LTTKKGKLSPVKEILFTYLAISKIIYWFNTITAMDHSNLAGVGEAVLMRLLGHDIMIVLGVVAFFFLDKFIEFKKSKQNKILDNIIYYAAGYVVLLGVSQAYMWVLSWFFEFTPTGSWVVSIAYTFAMYLVVVIAFNIKYHFKAKEKSEYLSVKTTDDKIAVLKNLLDEGVLTQEEFDGKKEKLLGM